MNILGKSKRIFGFILILCMALSHSVKALEVEKLDEICGKDRTDISIQASKYAWKNSNYVIIASSEDYADALCTIPLSRRLDAPILLIGKGGLNSEVEDEIKRLECRNIIIVGGKEVISQSVEEKLKHYGRVERIYGEDRYETSLNIAIYMGYSKSIILATGEDYADSILVGAVAGQADIPILLVNNKDVPKRTLNYIRKSMPSKIFIIGGEGVISAKINELFPTAERIWGKDRYDTNKALIERFYQSFNFNSIFLATNEDFSNSLLASMLAAKTSSPMILLNNSPKQLNDILNKRISPSTKFHLVGDKEKFSKEVISKVCIQSDVLDIKGKQYTDYDVKSDNVLIKAENIKLNKAKIEGNVYVQSNNVNLEDVKVKGDVLCDLEKDEALDIRNSKLYNLKTENSNNSKIYLKDSEVRNIFVEGTQENGVTEIIGSEDTKVLSTIVKSNVKLENVKGSFGNISVLSEGTNKKVIELKGNYDKPIYIQGNTTIKIDSKAKVKNLRLVTNNDKTSVRIDGNVEVVSFISPTFLELSNKTHIGKIEAVIGASGTVNIPEGAMVDEATDNISIMSRAVLPIKIVSPNEFPTE